MTVLAKGSYRGPYAPHVRVDVMCSGHRQFTGDHGTYEEVLIE